MADTKTKSPCYIWCAILPTDEDDRHDRVRAFVERARAEDYITNDLGVAGAWTDVDQHTRRYRIAGDQAVVQRLMVHDADAIVQLADSDELPNIKNCK